MIEKYEKYLELIGSLLQKYFEAQKDYINCKPGCSFCCEDGQYPLSELEFKYAMTGYNALDEHKKAIINDKIKGIKKAKEEYSGEEFMHECPFLIDKKCSIYNYRGIVCRTHGLMYFIKDKNEKTRNKGPNCVNFGLNYSNVYDKSTKMISLELWEKSGIKTQPVAYNIGLKTLVNNGLTKELELEFGEIKVLIDWL